jgi:hypothetical protein
MQATPKIFISYSWTNPNHEDWVINLAERLTGDGVDVIIDKWNLKEGQDMYDFMETMVKDKNIQKVLIILDKKYSEKAEDRSGGVGTETQIISPKIYADVSQEKFIPIIAEKDENGQAYTPTYLRSRIYIDLSAENSFEENYEKLLRNIYQRPSYSKPQLGKAPSYLFEETPMTHRTSGIIRSFDNQIAKSPQRIDSIIRDFLDIFFEDLKGYSINFNPSMFPNEIGKAIHDNILSYTPLRDDYILFLDKLLKSGIDFDIDIFIKFFERLPILKYPQDSRSSWNSTDFDNFKFFIHELFLYTIALGLKNEHYKFIEEIFYSGYFFQDKYNNKSNPQRFDVLHNDIKSFDSYYGQTFTKNLFSPMADLLIKRISQNITQDDLINADLLCHYIAVLENLWWFPITYTYQSDNGNFDLFFRLTSTRYISKVLGLFNVKTVQELREKIKNIQLLDTDPNRIRYADSRYSVMPIYKLIDIEKIGTMR